jgi:hypothetical protein
MCPAYCGFFTAKLRLAQGSADQGLRAVRDHALSRPDPLDVSLPC